MNENESLTDTLSAVAKQALTPNKEGRIKETLSDEKNTALAGAGTAAAGAVSGNVDLMLGGGGLAAMGFMLNDTSTGDPLPYTDKGLQEFMRSKRTYGGDKEAASDLDTREFGVERVDGDNTQVVHETGVQSAYEVFLSDGAENPGSEYETFEQLENGTEIARFDDRGYSQAVGLFEEKEGPMSEFPDSTDQCHFLDGDEVVGVEGLEYQDDGTIVVSEDNTAVRVRDYDGAGKQAAVMTGSIESGEYSEEGLYEALDESMPVEMSKHTVDLVVENSF